MAWLSSTRLHALALLGLACVYVAAARLPDEELEALSVVATTLGRSYWIRLDDNPCTNQPPWWFNNSIGNKVNESGIYCNCNTTDDNTTTTTTCHVTRLVLRSFGLNGSLPRQLVRLPFLEVIFYMASKRGGRDRRGRGAVSNAPSTTLPDPSVAIEELENATQTPSNSVGTISPNMELAGPPNVRGNTCGRGARKIMRSAKGRLTVEFDFGLMQAICDNTEIFNNEIGIIVRKNCSLQYKEWRYVPEVVKAPLRHKLLTLFDIDVEDSQVQKLIDLQMQKAWRSFKYRLHAHFKKIGGEEDLNKAKSNGPNDVTKDEWVYLCDIWSETSYKERAQKNAESRGKRKWESRNGSRRTTRHHVARGVGLTAPIGQIETWRSRHWHTEKGWYSPELEAKYDEMMQLRRDNPPEKMTDKAILENVLGRQSNRLVGWGRSPSKSKGMCGEDSRRPTYNQILGELNEYKSRFEVLEENYQKMQQVLIENNIIPHSSVLRVPLDNHPGPSHRDAPSGDDFDSDDLT